MEVLQSENQAAAAQAAGALWSLCVDNDANKQVEYVRLRLLHNHSDAMCVKGEMRVPTCAAAPSVDP